MNALSFRRCLSLSVTLALALSALPTTAQGTETERPGIYGEAADITPILGTHVTIDSYTFPYTGQEILPEVTVMVDDVLLEEGTHYTLTCKDNLEAGTGSVTVTGIPESGYEGIVTIPFAIEASDFTLVELIGTHVTLAETTFPYTGQPIVPAVTVTVDGKVLIQDKDYTLTCENNVNPGTATLTVEGIATASMTVGYTGTVTVEFTITEADQKPTEPEEPTKPEEPTEPENTEAPGDSETEEETKPVTYEITKGNKAIWYQNSGKTLSFTANGKLDAFVGISVDGKKLDKTHYAVKEGTTVALKTSFLNKLAVGKYTITIHFEDGDAEGIFTVSDKLDPSNPVTGDGSRVGVWIAVGLGSLAALGGAAFVLKKFLKK